MESLEWMPEIEVILYDTQDIVTTSGLLDEDELPPWVIG